MTRKPLQRVNHAGSQPGGRMMTQTTEATMREMPTMAIVFVWARSGLGEFGAEAVGVRGA